MSAKKAWMRLCQKHSPSKKVLISPIKHVCYHSSVFDLISEDRTAEAHLWALLTTEEFYYQETCSLVYQNFDSTNGIKKLLNDSRIIINWSERFDEYDLIGKGSFGEVYRGFDNNTGKYFALKRIKQKECDLNEGVEEFIGEILLEKSTLFEINRCPFFVRLVGSFTESTKKAYWFVMEYCICDLCKILSNYPPHKDNNSLWDDYMNENALELVDEHLSGVYHIRYTETIFLYFFEMLSALYYLAQRHIRHADLKCDNILISTTGHIKFGDFGLAFRDNWFYRNSLSVIAFEETEKEAIDSIDKTSEYRGNPKHYDPEMTINLMKRRNQELDKALDDYYATNEFYQPWKYKDQEFISDLFAVGLITSKMLFGGLNLRTKPKNQEHRQFWNIDVVYDEYINSVYIERRFLEQSDDERINSVMELLYLIFLPRKIRAKGYLSKKKVFSGSGIKTEKYINIKKVEKIPFYSYKSITIMNVLNKRFPAYYINKLSSAATNTETDITSQCPKDKQRVFNLPTFGFTKTKCFK